MPSTTNTALKPPMNRSAWGRTAVERRSSCPGPSVPSVVAASPRKAMYTGSRARTHGDTNDRSPAAKARAMLTSVIGSASHRGGDGSGVDDDRLRR